MEERKRDHIAMALGSRVARGMLDARFVYEPLWGIHPETWDVREIAFMGKRMHAPLWISSMTGGTEKAAHINRSLAKVAAAFGLGMGLGSCRILLEEPQRVGDFDVRDLLGDELPLAVNFGIAQVEQWAWAGDWKQLYEIVDLLRADGVVVHVNPLQEWFQREGDRLKHPPIDTIDRMVRAVDLPIVVKEVGQGMGPMSVRKLLRMPLEAIEFGAAGGTNFSKLEYRRRQVQQKPQESFIYVGHDAYQMAEWVNEMVRRHSEEVRTRWVIVSGGLTDSLDCYYFLEKLEMPVLCGLASALLPHALEGEEALRVFVRDLLEGIALASRFLRINPDFRAYE